MRASALSASATSHTSPSTSLGFSSARSVTHLPSARLSNGQILPEAALSAKRTSSCHSVDVLSGPKIDLALTLMLFAQQAGVPGDQELQFTFHHSAVQANVDWAVKSGPSPQWRR